MQYTKELFAVALRIPVYLYLFVLPASLTAQNPWINEIHYDNVGSDVMEYIEIVVPDPGCALPITIELYNGANSSSYSVFQIDGVSGELLLGNGIGCDVYDGGFYTIIGIELLPGGIQNGPDGIAIQCGAYVQFLTYGGSFDAADGIASGMTGTDIGITESGSAAVVFSAQLQGAGSVYSNFSWVIDSTTHCALNLDQTIFEATCTLQLDTAIISCNTYSEIIGDSVTVMVSYIGMDPDVELDLTLNDVPVPNLGDDPAVTPSGTIDFLAAEGDDFVVTFVDDCSQEIVFGTISSFQCKPSVRVSGDVFLHQSIDGVILKSPDGTCFRIAVSNTGVLSTTQVACPGE